MNYELLTKKKQRLDALRPLPKALLSNLEDWFRVELTYTSNALEGNTLTRHETALVVEKGLTVGGKRLVEHLEAVNLAYALDWVKAQVRRRVSDVSERDILDIHRLILKGIDDDVAGCYRKVPVRIAGSKVSLPAPMKVKELMSEFVASLNTANTHPVQIAADAHYQLVTIHPFVDGNGRTARLLMNLILLMHGYPTAIIRKGDRLHYLNALEKAQLGGAKDDYYQLIMKSVNRSLDVYLKASEEIIDDEVLGADLLKVGEFAKKAEEPVSTIRHWTKLGLLDVEEISPGGYQLYS